MRKKMTMNNEYGVSLKTAYEKFISVKRVMNLSKETLKYYYNCYRYFARFYKEDNLCSDISQDTIYSFIEHLKNNNEDLSSVTINSYLRGIRAMIYFFMEKGYMNEFRISLIKSEKKIKETYSEDELERLLRKPDIKHANFSEYRNWVIVCYLLATGNRLRTLCNVKIQDIDFENHEIILRKVKNGKHYIIPLSVTLEKVLLEYLQYRDGKDEEYLFCNAFGEQLCKNTLIAAIRRYNHSRGVTKTSIHLFRHTFAKNWILSGGDIFRLQKILGHSSLDIVKEYVNMFGGDLKNNFDKFNPLDNMNGSMGSKKHIKMKD